MRDHLNTSYINSVSVKKKQTINEAHSGTGFHRLLLRWQVYIICIRLEHYFLFRVQNADSCKSYINNAVTINVAFYQHISINYVAKWFERHVAGATWHDQRASERASESCTCIRVMDHFTVSHSAR